jgi:small subunit ribosomal protein S5
MPNQEETTKETVVEETVAATPAETTQDQSDKDKERAAFSSKNSFRDRRKNERRPSRRPERARQEFDNKIVSVRRVTRVVAGGRRFSFSVSIVIGDKKGRVGVGVGKATDTPIAVHKATEAAKKNMITVPLTKKGSIAHQVEAKYSSAVVSIVPAPGKGVVAGSAVRVVLELAGVKEVTSKILSRSKNKLNIARAAIKALQRLKNQKVKKV